MPVHRILTKHHAPAAAPIAVLLIALASAAFAFDPGTLPEVGYHPGGIAYWDTPFFANALYNGGQWLEYAPGEWGRSIDLWNNPQFDANGLPQYLNPGKQLRGICYALHSNYDNRPAAWPRRSTLAEGRVVLAWRGDADIRLRGGTFLAGESSGASTGRLVDGRRVYRYSGGSHLEWLEVHEINAAAPIRDIKVWLADPADPANRSLEGQIYHPTFLARLRDADWGFIRFMNFLDTNANPQRDWSDRRPPTHCFMTGVLNPRSPASGFEGRRGSGVAFEMMPALCNAADKDLWVCVPHLATDEFVRRLAQLIRYGSDGVDPYTTEVADPVYPPLNPRLRVYIEYSNEIWSGGNAFPQGNWADEQAKALGIGKPQFNARRFCEIWRIFQEAFGGTERLVRVAAVFTAGDWYTRPFLQEMKAYGPTLVPAVEPDVIAATTYFGNGIQDWVYETAQRQAGTADPWFFTGATFDAGGGNQRPVSLPASHAYWTSATFARHMDEAFAEWTKRLLSGDAREGAGPDAVGIGGGFEPWLRDLARTTFPTPKPIIAYEGGPSIYTDDKDGGDARDDGLTTFLEAMNRRPGMRDVYAMHLNMARSKGLRTHVIFTDCGTWGKYGQWGHLEHLDQEPARAVKYQFILDWFEEMKGVRHIDDPAGATPRFETSHSLPVALVGQAYAADIRTTGGDGARTIARIGQSMTAGLACAVTSAPDRARIAGTPQAAGLSYAYLRVTDADGDPAWRTFVVRAVGGPGTLVEADFRGTNPAQHFPWTRVYYRAEGLDWSGWRKGGGVQSRDGDNALVWSVDAPSNESSSTLTLAIADGEYLAVTLQAPAGATLDVRGARMRFTIRRIDYHAPRRYAVLTGIGGFADGAQVFDGAREDDMRDVEFAFRLPDTQAYGSLADPVEIRIYGYAGQWGGHRTSLVDFRLEGRIVKPALAACAETWGTYE